MAEPAATRPPRRYHGKPDPRPCARCGRTIHPHRDTPDEPLCSACQIASIELR